MNIDKINDSKMLLNNLIKNCKNNELKFESEFEKKYFTNGKINITIPEFFEKFQSFSNTFNSIRTKNSQISSFAQKKQTRSLKDILRTLIYYYPDVDFIEFLQYMIKYITNNRGYLYYCDNIQSVIYKMDKDGENVPYESVKYYGFINTNTKESSYVDCKIPECWNETDFIDDDGEIDSELIKDDLVYYGWVNEVGEINLSLSDILSMINLIKKN